MDAKFKYDNLITGARRNPSEFNRTRASEEAESDRGRVLYSSPFRRLQNKAQVFSLETNAAIRSRLTHSLEVSSVGRTIAQKLVIELSQNKSLNLTPDIQHAFITFVETACLLHDIGNPPFGHYGELAISDWFEMQENSFLGLFSRESPDNRKNIKKTFQDYYEDLKNFDGNAQGLRIIARLQQSRDVFGLNLTFTQLAAYLKYPCTSHEIKEYGYKKGGYFKTESDVVEQTRNALNLKAGQRHPLAFIMEAADDISYCLSDVEDGLEKQLISPQEFASRMSEANKKNKCEEVKKAIELLMETASNQHWERGFLKFRTDLTRYLIQQASQSYL